MQFDLLTLPFIGGYIFYTRFSHTAYSAVRAVGQHLILRSALCGFFLLLISRLLLIGAPYVAKHGDQFLAITMSTVPGLSFIGAFALFDYLYPAFKLKPVNMLRSPRAVWLLLNSAGLILVAVFTVRSAPGNGVWILAGVCVTLFVTLSAWTLSTYTTSDFRQAIFRVSWFLLILVLVVAVSADYGDDIGDMWRAFSPFPDSGAPALALLIGVSAWYPLNLLIPYKTALERFHRLGNSDAMDRFLFDAAEGKALLQLTLSDGKFYVGTIQVLAANPVAPNSFVRILPYASGYRDKDTKELVFTSFYQDVYDELTKEEASSSEFSLDQFIKVLPFSAIFSANRFDPRIYIRFKRESAQGSKSVQSDGEMSGG